MYNLPCMLKGFNQANSTTCCHPRLWLYLWLSLLLKRWGYLPQELIITKMKAREIICNWKIWHSFDNPQLQCYGWFWGCQKTRVQDPAPLYAGCMTLNKWISVNEALSLHISKTKTRHVISEKGENWMKQHKSTLWNTIFLPFFPQTPFAHIKIFIFIDLNYRLLWYNSPIDGSCSISQTPSCCDLTCTEEAGHIEMSPINTGFRSRQ